PDVASDPTSFAGHLVRTVARYVQHAMPKDSKRVQEMVQQSTPMVGETRRRRRFSGAVGWLSARLELATELESLAAPRPRPSREIIDQAIAVLQLISDHGLRPVLVFDDTDKWFGAGIDDTDRLLEGFFTRVIRLIAEELAATAVLAVHTGYLDHPAYGKAAGFIESTIRVPRLPDATALNRLLLHRTKGLQVLSAEALEAVFAYYDEVPTSDLRQRVLLIVHTALSHACDDESEQIDVQHIELAIAEYGTSPTGRRWSWRRRR
ncbi:MAG TPA: hypothetical protein VI076_01665, partial [Actinopolymorphaceae bacterium]